ncbi:hypothetical protein LTSEADE_4293 [Salmonella enterica subsp. enterica serovar Adelaide str. A4-669]|uniref:Uncharacterized protein n=1 Tax=Salmonella enterica subsp. enterica serovar Adelaide str. A4-669 TaxID=913063 RepID=A0A6C8GJ13_SALET|nr:hypothetical protein LTSEADE_4293 [Salmonella enterica subsp. enterica serovar Adelaide str. A4-669]
MSCIVGLWEKTRAALNVRSAINQRAGIPASAINQRAGIRNPCP